MQEKEQEINLILYDYLSFTSKRHTPRELIQAMGFPDDIPWQDVKGSRGYRDRMYFNCISIHYNGRDDMGVWVELTGQGCRAFETLSTLKDCWKDIFWFIFRTDCNVTRLDIAYDDHVGILDLNVIKQDTEREEYISKATYWEVVNSSKGLTVYIGSSQSPVLIRMYDKARERNCEPGTHWVRVEIQLRDDRAKKFLGLDFDYSIGDAFCGVLLNYLRYVEPDPLDSNRWRWPLKDYWGNFLLGASKISIYEKPGLEYNLERCHNYVINQAGNALDAYIQCVGMEGLKRALKERTTKPNPKYQQMIDSAKRFNI